MLIVTICIPGHVYSKKFTVSGTSYFNITGTIRTHVNKISHILDRESEEYQSIATNFTRGVKIYISVENKVSNYP